MSVDPLFSEEVLTSAKSGPAENLIARPVRVDLLLKDLFRNWPAIIGMTLAAVLIAGFSLAWIGPTYTATMIVTPNTESALEKVQFYSGNYRFAQESPLLGRFGRPEPEVFDHFIVLLKSNRIAQALEDRYAVSRSIFPDLWDQDRNQWRPPSGPVAEFRRALHRLFGYPAWQPPRARGVQAYFERHLEVAPVAGGAMRAVSLSGSDPQLVARILDWLFEETTALLRRERNAALRSNIAYLKARLAEERIDLYRESLLSLLADQERQFMLSQAAQPFGAVLLESPVEPEIPSSLDPFWILILAAGAGAGLCSLLVLGVSLPRRRPLPAPSARSEAALSPQG